MSEHLSASARRIRDLESQLAIYQLMAKEYNALLNYLVVYHHTNNEMNALADGSEFVINAAKMRTLEMQTIRTEISDNKTTMRITRIPSDDNLPVQSRIILPPGRA
jgi:hypothetical protein